MELYVEKIMADLARMGKNRHWLAQEVKKVSGHSIQLVYYWLSEESPKGAKWIARVLKYSNPKDLIR